MVVNLFLNFYVDPNLGRQCELDESLHNNINNSHIDTIHIFVDELAYDYIIKNFENINKFNFIIQDKRPTYSDYFITTRQYPDDINIITNADIYFDDTFKILKYLPWDTDTCFALSRWDKKYIGDTGEFELIHYDVECSQDCWVFFGKVKCDITVDFTCGILGCDNKVAYHLSKSGYKVLNPSKTIKCIHTHNSNHRNYVRDENCKTFYRIPDPYLFIPTSELETPKGIQLFNIPNHIINTNVYSNLLHDNIVIDFETTIKEYVGAKYAVTFNSATSAIFLALLGKEITVKIPSMIPPVVLNAIITSGNKYKFVDNVNWVGGSYILHDFGDYKIVDSAQRLDRNQFKDECNDNDLMIFSFYPTKPIGTCDGGMIVSNDLNKIIKLKELALNGMSFSENNWERKIMLPGYKMYMNSIQCDIALRNFKNYESKLKQLGEIRSKYNAELDYSNTSNHLYTIDVENRVKFLEHMKYNRIVCGVHYDAAHLNPVYSQPNTICPMSEKKSLQTVSIPFHEMLTLGDTDIIINHIKRFIIK